MSLNSLRSPPFIILYYTTSSSCSYNNSNKMFRHHRRRRNPYLLLLEKNVQPRPSFLISLEDGWVSTKASSGHHSHNNNNVSESVLLEDEVISRASTLNDANQVIEMIGEISSSGGGVVSSSDCCRIIKAALHSNNTNLALSIFAAMRSSPAFHQDVVKENGSLVERWRWPRPELSAYTTLVIGLAASLRVSDALRILDDICTVGLSSVEEVPFGKIVRCPSCLIAVGVAQPQQGIQVCTSSR